MRALVITEDLLEAAWKFTLKSAPVPMSDNCIAEKAKTSKLSFHQKAKITISVCVGLFFCSFMLFFVLWPVEEEELIIGNGGRGWVMVESRRILESSISNINKNIVNGGEMRVRGLHGMGVVFKSKRRRRRSMKELIVAHLTEGVTDSELRMFLRTLYRSGALARADLVMLFPKNSLTEDAFNVIEEECDMGFKKLSLCLQYTCNSNSVSLFNAAAFREAAEEESKGRGGKSVGSITGFEMEELDPDNMLHGFIDDPPAQLRRWVCYQLLLGMLRHKYRRVLLARIGAVFIIGDALASTRKKSNADLILLMESRSWDLPYTTGEFYNSTQDRVCSCCHSRKHITPQKSKAKVGRGRHKKSLVEGVYGDDVWRWLVREERQRRLISSGIMTGTVSSVRALANAMVNEIVRVSVLEERAT